MANSWDKMNVNEITERKLDEEFDLGQGDGTCWLDKILMDDDISVVEDEGKEVNFEENADQANELLDRKLKLVIHKLSSKIDNNFKNFKEEINDKLENFSKALVDSSDNCNMLTKPEKNSEAELKNNNCQQISNINDKLADLSVRLEKMKMKDWSRDITEMELRSKLYWVERYALSKNIVFNNNALQENYKNSKVVFTWTITPVGEEELKDKNFKVESDALPETGYPIKTAKVQQIGDSFCVYLVIADNVSLAQKQLYPKIDFVLKDRSGSTKCLDIVQTCDLSQWSSYGFYQFVGPCAEFPVAKVLDPAYNVDQTIQLEIYVEPQSMASQVIALDGTLLWTIEDFHKRRDLEVEGLVKNHPSPYFYTSCTGFRMQAHVNFFGQEKNGDGLKVTINFLSGEFDQELASMFDVSPEKLPNRATVTLLNRNVPSKSITKSTVIKIIGRFSMNICDQEELLKMIENDTLYLKVEIV